MTHTDSTVSDAELLRKHYSCIKEPVLSPERLEGFRSQFISPDFPVSISLELGEFRCTHRCRMCPQSTVPFTGPDRFMDEKTLDRILDRIDPGRDIMLEISAYGETFLHPRALDFIVRAKERLPRSKLVVATNGLLMNEKIAAGLVKADVDFIQVSLNTGSESSYEWFCGRPAYRQVVENLERLIELRNKSRSQSKVTTHIIEVKELEHEFLPFVKTWAGRADQVHIRGYGNWGGMVSGNRLSGLHPVPAKRYPCISLFCSLEILSDGSAHKCFLHGVPGAEDSGRVGTLINQSVEEIWKGELMEGIRAKHMSGEYDTLPFCRDCTSWSLFPNLWQTHSAPERCRS